MIGEVSHDPRGLKLGIESSYGVVDVEGVNCWLKGSIRGGMTETLALLPYYTCRHLGTYPMCSFLVTSLSVSRTVGRD